KRRPGLSPVLVTHHLEERSVSTSHLLLFRDGRPFAAAQAGDVLTSDLVSACFGLPVTISRQAGRWAATAGPASQASTGTAAVSLPASTPGLAWDAPAAAPAGAASDRS
ncbi:MAG: hypothetical protein ACR2FU_14315, partial [Streptosporangiaceae bacterium]